MPRLWYSALSVGIDPANCAWGYSLSIHPIYRRGSDGPQPRLHPAAWLLAALLALVLALPAAAQVIVQQADQLAAISPFLETQLSAGSEPVSFLVVLREQVDAQPLLDAAFTEPFDRTARATELYHTLTSRAQQSQAPLRAWLDANGIPYRPFYIVNMIEVRGDAAAAQALRRFAAVDRLAANPLVSGQNVLPPAIFQKASSFLENGEVVLAGQDNAMPAQAALDLPYGLTYTHAPAVWDLGFRGQGIVVASQDTGVQWDHPALKERYRGWDAQQAKAAHAYNWFDAWGDSSCASDPQIACDDSGHGTHTVGTMVGAGADSGYSVLGMAPDAQWIGCRNMLNGEGTPASYAACFEFMLAPYPQGGDPFTDGRPELAPHIINNSWSCPADEGCDADSLRRVVETVRSAGQLIVASAGNYGPACSTVQFPIGMHDAVFSIGAHDSAGALASFSSRGPVTSDGSNRLKPDLVAPGVSVLSAYPTASYGYLSGTSMSSPHVAGAAALLWSAAPELIGNVDLTEQVLIKSATPVPDSQCLPGVAPVTPNPAYGYGRLDVYAAVEMALTPWQVAVKVVDAAGEPRDNVPVVIVDALTGYPYRTLTGFNGMARFPRIYYGRYMLRVGQGSDRIQIAGVNLSPDGDPITGERRYIRQITYHPFTPSNWIYLPTLVQN